MFFYWNPKFLYCVLPERDNGNAPKCLTDFLVLHQSNRHLCSNATDNLQLCRMVFRTTKHGGGTFQSCAPMFWNDLPLDAGSDLSVYIFKNRLKTCHSSSLFSFYNYN